jgi:hypothetical protein
VVQRVFAEFLAAYGIGAIADRLTAEGIPCPSAHDRRRNPHRVGLAWTKGAVRTILRNPRYTGRQVWNRQRKDEVLLDVNDVALGFTTKQRWNDADQWIYSRQLAHPTIVEDNTFEQVQQLLAAKDQRPAVRRLRLTAHPYAFRDLLYCGLCGRRMQGSRNNNQAYYRCRMLDEVPRSFRTGIQ